MFFILDFVKEQVANLGEIVSYFATHYSLLVTGIMIGAIMALLNRTIALIIAIILMALMLLFYNSNLLIQQEVRIEYEKCTLGTDLPDYAYSPLDSPRFNNIA
jgi:hypothetical protein